MRQEPLNDVGFWKAGQCGHLGEPSSGVHGCRYARLLERLCTSRECFRPREELSRVGWESVKKAFGGGRGSRNTAGHREEKHNLVSVFFFTPVAESVQTIDGLPWTNQENGGIYLGYQLFGYRADHQAF